MHHLLDSTLNFPDMCAASFSRDAYTIGNLGIWCPHWVNHLFTGYAYQSGQQVREVCACDYMEDYKSSKS